MADDFDPHRYYGTPVGASPERVCQVRHEIAVMMAVTSIATQLQATAEEVDVVWLEVKREFVPRLPSELIHLVARKLGEHRAEMRHL